VLSAKVVRNLQVAFVLITPIVATLFVPHGILIPAAWSVFAVAVGGVVAVKWYMGRLQKAGTLDEPGRRQFLVEIGMALAIPGLVAFIVLLVEYAD
jgi:hypothetical protein